MYVLYVLFVCPCVPVLVSLVVSSPAKGQTIEVNVISATVLGTYAAPMYVCTVCICMYFCINLLLQTLKYMYVCYYICGCQIFSYTYVRTYVWMYVYMYSMYLLYCFTILLIIMIMIINQQSSS